ncbi:Hypothetical protein FKW44_003747 [Caligus rogercresseyi]|uniref:Uncharacterized protein n=1 Tax=Caligus rogercresseyi TaxID=217165 RepID=A0A7T8QX78_CALRO|nr:Hypothetical protein FKW44_003747 [Caligus rogercresseyi]
MHVPTLPPIPGVPDPEGRGTGDKITLLTRPDLCGRFLFPEVEAPAPEDEFGGYKGLHSPFSSR